MQKVLCTVGVNDLADLANALLEDAVGRGIGDHHCGENVRILLGLRAQVIDIDIAAVVAEHTDDFHPGHLRGGWVGAVRGRGNEADVAV